MYPIALILFVALELAKHLSNIEILALPLRKLITSM
jgi:hypothetical protein